MALRRRRLRRDRKVARELLDMLRHANPYWIGGRDPSGTAVVEWRRTLCVRITVRDRALLVRALRRGA